MINRVQCFTYEEIPGQPHKVKIVPIHENFHLTHTEGSFNVVCARLMNLSYAQYLRFCRDMCQGEIVGKYSLYPTVYFPDNETFHMLLRLLNTRANLVLWERENPDWKAHAEDLASGAVFNKKKMGAANDN